MYQPIDQVVAEFDVPGKVVDAKAIGTGHIHDTYRVRIAEGSRNSEFTLQRINDRVFRNPPAVMENIVRVSEHLRGKLDAEQVDDIERHLLRVIPAREGKPYYYDVVNGYWRMYAYIGGAHTVSQHETARGVATDEEIYEAAWAFGRFQRMLADLPCSALVETIAGFHDGTRRAAALDDSAGRDPCNRASAVTSELEWLAERRWLLAEPQRLVQLGELTLRPCHNDTKATNVLLDNQTNRALCVIDLDTVMPGLALYDYGDLVRTTVSDAPEDAQDISSISLMTSRLRAASEGFRAGADHLHAREVDSLSLGPPYMALIMATRFLTDYLDGDVYYKVERPGQNLDRCRAQLAIARLLMEEL